MARGNQIIVNTEPKGRFDEGYIASGITPKPGTIMQKDPTVALKGGRHTYKLYDRAADGNRPAGPLYVLMEDYLQGKTVNDAYAAGTRCFVYAPVTGDELNVIVEDVSGEDDDHPLGELLVVNDGTGKLVVAPGTEDAAPFQLLEAITNPTADTLAWVQFSGSAG